MAIPRKVAVYGNSLFVAGIEASIRNQPGMVVSRLSPSLADPMSAMEQFCPDAVIFDLAAARPEFGIALLAQYPHLILIGLNLESSTVLIFSGQHSQVSTTDDLIQVINQARTGGYGETPDSSTPRTDSHDDVRSPSSDDSSV